MKNVITTTDIWFHGKRWPEGHKFVGLDDEDAQSLIAQGVAKKATRVIEVDDDEQVPAQTTKAPAKAAQAPQEEKQGTAVTTSERPAVNKDMTRDQLDEIAKAEGFAEDELEKLETKADVVQAIKDRRATPQEEKQGE